MRLCSRLATAAIAGVLLAPGTAAAVPDYCAPESSQYDPGDVPAGGAALLNAPGVTRTTVEARGLRTPVLQTGPRTSREAVVFLHGSPGSSQDWLGLLPRVGALGRRAVAWDMPGFGHADKPWDLSTDIDEAARFIQAMLERLGITRVHLVIQDLGGAGGLQWAAAHPKALLSAVVIDSGLLGYKHHQFAQIARTPVGGETFFLAMNRMTWTNGMQQGNEERPLPQEFVNRIYDDLDRRTRCTILRVYRSAEEDQINQWGRAQAHVLSRRRRPALILWGSRDPYLPPEMAVRQLEVFPGARIHFFDESGHWPFIDDPEGAARLVVPFVRCQPTGKKDRIRLSAKPRSVPADEPITVRLKATVRRDGLTRPVCDARIRFAGRKLDTDKRGKLRLDLAGLDPGTYRARASKPGLRDGRARLTAR